MKRLHPSGPDMEQPKRMNWIGNIKYLTYVDTLIISNIKNLNRKL